METCEKQFSEATNRCFGHEWREDKLNSAMKTPGSRAGR